MRSRFLFFPDNALVNLSKIMPGTAVANRIPRAMAIHAYASTGVNCEIGKFAFGIEKLNSEPKYPPTSWSFSARKNTQLNNTTRKAYIV